MARRQIVSDPSSSSKRIARLIRTSPSPPLARANFARLIEAGGQNSLEAFPKTSLGPLFRLLGGSAFLSELLIREGKGWPGAFLRFLSAPAKSAADHQAGLASLLREEISGEQFLSGLRRYKQREFLGIGLRDFSSFRAVERTTQELSALADAGLEAACRFFRLELERAFGPLFLPVSGNKNRFVILGMGKLGGEELNFSSDIDLIYLYEQEEGESLGGARGKIGPAAYFTRLAEMINRAMGEITEEGSVFRIDLRLRPLGRHGPLVQSLPSALLYYESWGQCWERSAFIKARPVAGDLELGVEFLHEMRPFIYRRYLDFTTVEELREMKERIERELLDPAGRKRNVKLGYGGIREVEFFTQALQLVNGGYEPGIREHNTLRALEKLAAHGFIPARECLELGRAYRFLRDVEHKLQMTEGAQTHSIPARREEEIALARRLGYRREKKRDERALFWRDYRGQTARVRRVFDRLFYGGPRTSRSQAGPEPGGIWNDLDDEERVVKELARAGFQEPERAYRNLIVLRDGDPYAPPGLKRHKIMDALGPVLMAEILKSGAPDQALFYLAEFSRRVGGRTGFFSLLAENPKTLRLLVDLCAHSELLVDLFLKRPELLDSLMRRDLTRRRKSRKEILAELRTALGAAADLEEKLNALRRYRAEEFLRIGLHDLGEELGLGEVQGQLSDLAEACVAAALELASQEMEKTYGLLPLRFAVFGMGKLGGREIDYNSDLDLIFLYDAAGKSPNGGAEETDAQEQALRLGQKLITFLSVLTQEGRAYSIDMRLRPSGRFGPLVSAMEAFRGYHLTSAELWERQALVKFRFVAGDRLLGREAESVAQSAAYGRGLRADEIREIDHLRMRMEKELAGESEAQFELKRGKGGIVDIEFLAQMLQLSHGGRRLEVRKKGTLEALAALRRCRLLGAQDARLLSEGYLFLRRLDHRLRLERDQPIHVLEREPRKLEGVARALGFRGRGGKSAGDLLLLGYEKRRERIRACYLRFFH